MWCNIRSIQEGLQPAYIISDNKEIRWSRKANGYRLPTITERRFAYRGGLKGMRFPWGNTISHSQANYYSTVQDLFDTSQTGYHPKYCTGEMPYTSPVGSFAPNGYGLYDMAGNVWEWCWNCYIHGGSWNDNANDARCADRDLNGPAVAYGSIGFRCVRNAE